MFGQRLIFWSTSVLMLLCFCACDTARAPSTPPRCEPASEVELERTLKDGFRAISESRDKEATESFRRVLEVHGEHPEARAGLRAVLRARRRASQNRPPSQSPGQIWVNGEQRDIHLEVDNRSLRYEEEAARDTLAKDLKLSQPSGAPGFEPRASDKPSQWNLVVLQASGGQTAREHLLRTRRNGTATHFLVDWDGQVFQTLDLGQRAKHTGDTDLDQRSISITLVNPMQTDKDALPPIAAGSEHVRPMPAPATVHGQLVQTWGYTVGQERSLIRLLQGLRRHLSALPGTVPVHLGVIPPPERVGVIGMLHLDSGAVTPGVGLDWNNIRRALKTR
ncbi:MAG: N-acetylmuramoyl-L-alanine amidase [Myxococcota bacterium]|nr:N-acetylmuramoyl-L-alanine amidase [Myxococcota bacterium]